MQATQEKKGISFDNGSATISLQELKQTVTLESAKGGLPKNRPIEHFALIEQVINLFSNELKDTQSIPKVDANAQPQESSDTHTELILDPGMLPLTEVLKLEPIHINENYAKRIMWPSKTEPCPINHYLIERLVSRIIIPRGNAKTEQAIAISYTDDGIAMAIGTNVTVCSNMTIFGSNYMSTSGANKTPFEKMVQIVKHWAQNLKKFFEADAKVIESLAAIELDRKMTDELIGTLIRKSVMANHTGQISSPMNVTQVHRMIEQGGEMFTKDNFENFSAWDFNNHLTAVLKPQTTDLTKLLNSQNQVSKFVCESLGISYPMEELILN